MNTISAPSCGPVRSGVASTPPIPVEKLDHGVVRRGYRHRARDAVVTRNVTDFGTTGADVVDPWAGA